MSKLAILAKMISHCSPWWIPFADRLGWLPQGRKYPVHYRGTLWNCRGGVGDFSVLNEMFLHGAYDLAFRNLRSGATVIDIGANIGAFSVAAAKAGAAAIWAFEPVPANQALLRENVAANRLQTIVQLVPNAVAREPGTLTLYTRDTDAGGGTLYPEIHRSWHASDGAMASDIRPIEVQCVNLNEFFGREKIQYCDLLKLDCEGAEFEIIDSLDADTVKAIGAVVFEYHSDGKLDAIIALLKKLGFTRIDRHPVYQVILMNRV